MADFLGYVAVGAFALLIFVLLVRALHSVPPPDTSVTTSKTDDAELAVKVQEIARKIRSRSEGWEQLPDLGEKDDLQLEKNEVLHLAGSAILIGLKTRRSPAVYHGLSVRVPIAKGLSYRAGTSSRVGERTEEWSKIEEGGLYLTNRRLLFQGEKRNASVRISKVTRITECGNNVVRLDKETGQPFVFFSKYDALFSATLERLVSDR